MGARAIRRLLIAGSLALGGCSETAPREAARARSEPLVVLRQQTLTEPEAVDFGRRVAIFGDGALVVAQNATNGAGEFHSFRRTNGVWVKEGGGLGGGGKSLGCSLALSDFWAFLGECDTASVHVFNRAGSWGIWGVPLTSDTPFDRFGSAVALSGNTVLVGAPGSGTDSNTGKAHVFVWNGAYWATGPVLEAPEPWAPSAGFGYSVALSGDTAAIGAPGANLVHVFVRDGSDWLPQGPPLGPPPGWPTVSFGYAVALSGDSLLVTDPDLSLENRLRAGALFAFERSNGAWAHHGPPKIGSSVGSGEQFGTSVAIDGDLAVVGVGIADPLHPDPPGAAYVFERGQGEWLQRGPAIVPPLAPSSIEPLFGRHVAISGQTALVGAAFPETGAVFVLSLGEEVCTSDSECGSGHCVRGVCCDRECDGACEVCTRALGAPADGTCVVAPAGYVGNPACAPLVCDGASSACVSCVTDAQCPTDHYCAAGGSCSPRKPQGAACDDAAGADCEQAGCRVCSGSGQGICADGVCCDVPCEAACEACSVARGAQVDGTCALVPAGFEGSPACPAGYACNGVDRVCPGACASDSDCAPDHYCSAAGECRPRLAIGAPCATDSGSACHVSGCRICEGSASCVDGVCCDQPCTGGCDVCAASLGAERDGQCTLLSAGSASEAACGAGLACDGLSADCPDPCTNDDDCVAGYRCNAGACVPLGEHCSADRSSRLDAAGRVLEECAPFACEDGACLTACTTSEDCTHGSVCDLELGSCVSDVDARTVAACGCRTSSPRTGASWAWLCVVVSLLLVRRRTSALAIAAWFFTLLAGCNAGDRRPESTSVRRHELTFSRQAELIGSGENIGPNALNVAISDDTAAVVSQHQPARVDIFVRSGATWSRQGPALVAPEAAESFGRALALDGDTLMVGASGTAVGGLTGAGAVYVYARSGDTWTAIAEPLVAPDPAPGSAFGVALALSNDTLLVGAARAYDGTDPAAGAVYVFMRAGDNWTQQGPALTVPEIPGERVVGRLGAAIALSGDTALVGAPYTTLTATQQGAAFLFTRSDGVWTLEATLSSPASKGHDHFGESVALLGDTALVGAPGYDVYGSAFAPDEGALFVFQRTDGSWTQQGPPLVAASGSGDRALERLGTAVALRPDLAIGGAPAGFSSGIQTGLVHVFGRREGVWSRWPLPLEPGSSTSSSTVGNFGIVLAASGDVLLVGAAERGGDGDGRSVGIVFALVGGPCTDDAACASGFCVDGVCCNSACSESCDVCSAALGATEDGICTVAPAGYPGLPACAPAACTGEVSSCEPCTSDAHCPPNAYCTAQGRCAARKPVGAACDLASGADCAEAGCRACDGYGSGHCVDGVCCESACDRACDVCATLLGSSRDGACEPAPEGTPGSSACEAGYACNGIGVDCPERCNTDRDCASTHHCDSAGNCVARKPVGAPCDDGVGRDCRVEGCRVCETGAGACRDGVCCDSRCDGACETCSREGVCGFAPEGSSGVPQCMGGFACDGRSSDCPTRCSTAAQCRPGLICIDGACVDEELGCSDDGAAEIDVVGSIVRECAPYRCRAGACLGSCTSTEDCVKGALCDVESRICVADLGSSTAGCGCRAPGRGPRGEWGACAALLLFALGRARRRAA